MTGLRVNEIYNMDCREGMRSVPDSTVDLVVTDPPFAIGFKAVRSNYNRSQPPVGMGQRDDWDGVLFPRFPVAG